MRGGEMKDSVGTSFSFFFVIFFLSVPVSLDVIPKVDSMSCCEVVWERKLLFYQMNQQSGLNQT